MPDWSNLEESMKAIEPVRKAFAPCRHRAVPVFEDCLNYPEEPLLALYRLAEEIESVPYNEETEGKIARFAVLLDQIQPVDNPQPRRYLWPEGKMPAETAYMDNSSFRYNHDPDFNPYLFEMLLPEDVTPKGAVILCAGGDHGAPCVKGWQVGKDLNDLGYQCFLLLNRINHNPWTAREAGADAARAVRMVRAEAARYRIHPRSIAFAGFSNGGLTGEGLIQYFSGSQTVAASFPGYLPDELDRVDATPDAFLCIYGPRFVGDSFDYSRVHYPPTFFAVGREDSAMDNLHYTYPDLVAHGVPVEVHTFAGVPHGQAGGKLLGVQYPNFELWEPLADAFMQDVFSRHAD